MKSDSNVKHRTRGVTSKKIRRAKRKIKKNFRMIKTEDEKKIKNDQNGKRKE